ncbi:MAG: NAD-dependent epimerase/dehydratase family protein [Methylococcales bacterium]
MNKKIVITGGAGLAGQNLVLMLREQGFSNLCAIDKHASNLQLLSRLNPGVRAVCADIAQSGPWDDEFSGCDIAIVLHAQITAKDSQPFVRNNIDASKAVFETLRQHLVPYVIHISSSVVNSFADDDYTNTKKAQEKLFLDSGLNGCVLRPTLMYGWFDPKHFGWLSRFMEKAPLFPIPGSGRYMRQPLYERDFCRAIIWCIENRPERKIYDLVGQERIDYIDIIRAIRQVKGLNIPIVKIPCRLFEWLLRIYALFSDKPPFTASQLKALTAGDDFKGVDIEKTFGFKPTPFAEGIRETFCHPVYSTCVVERT